MSFSLDARHIDTIRDYGDAIATYNKIKPWKGEEEIGDWRCLDTANQRKRHVRIRLNKETGDYECRLHDTNVVTYHENGDITIKGYQSVSTGNFASALLPVDFYPWMARQAGSVIGVETRDGDRSGWNGHGKRFYQLTHTCEEYIAIYGRTTVGKGVRFTKKDGYWLPHASTPPVPFESYTLDRSRTREVLKKHRYADFCHFVNGVVTIARSGGAKLNCTDAPYGLPGRDAIVEMVDDQSRWMELLKSYLKASRDVTSASGLLDKVRMAIYHGEDVVVRDDVPYVDGFRALRALDAAEARYRYL